MYLVDLPGYGYARGARGGPAEFARLVGDYLGSGATGVGALLLVDARHPGLQSDIEAWRWLTRTVERSALVATKIDKLSRAERQRAMQQCEAVYEHPVLPVSAVTGEGLDDLWILIDSLANHRNPQPLSSRRSPQRATAPPARKR